MLQPSAKLFALVYWKHLLKIVKERLQKYLKSGHFYDSKASMTEISKRALFWLEVLLCCVYLLPGVTGEISVLQLNNIVVYRYEMIGTSWNILGRLYLL